MIVVSPARSSLRYGALLYIMIHQSHFLKCSLCLTAVSQYSHQNTFTWSKQTTANSENTQKTLTSYTDVLFLCFMKSLEILPCSRDNKRVFIFFTFFIFFMKSSEILPCSRDNKRVAQTSIQTILSLQKSPGSFYVFYIFCILCFVFYCTFDNTRVGLQFHPN